MQIAGPSKAQALAKAWIAWSVDDRARVFHAFPQNFQISTGISTAKRRSLLQVRFPSEILLALSVRFSSREERSVLRGSQPYSWRVDWSLICGGFAASAANACLVR